MGTSKWEKLHDAVQDFSSQLLSSNNGAIRLGLGSFGSIKDKSVFAEIGKFPNGSSFTDDPTQLMNQSIIKDSPQFDSATPTFMGVDAGYKMLNDVKYGVRSDAEKVLIVLTDGLPTFYPKTQNYNNELDTNGVNVQNLNDSDEYTLSNTWQKEYFGEMGPLITTILMTVFHQQLIILGVKIISSQLSVSTLLDLGQTKTI
ncbi:vWA domain-containing protein [Lactococcus garvieae]